MLRWLVAKLRVVQFLILGVSSQNLNTNLFPDDFLFGVATSAYQIEGAWNTSGKGASIWDTLTHTTDLVVDGSTGDIACDSYNYIAEDIALVKSLGVDFYRLSLSWSRILPYGYPHYVNPDGIRYYNEVIDGLLAENVQPMLTLYHWDLPQYLQDIGGWANEKLVDYFEDYARIAFEAFGDRVKVWITFNEPAVFCYQGYGIRGKAPAVNATGIGGYLCGHTVLKAHARVYHVYDEEFRSRQEGTISITLDSTWYEPNNTESPLDQEAAQRVQQLSLGWFAHPIFSDTGDYPVEMRRAVAYRSFAEGFRESRLPKFTDEEIQYIKGTYDWFGLNHYTTVMVADIEDLPYGTPHQEKDKRASGWQDSSWPTTASGWFKVVPWGFRNILNWIKKEYGDVPIYVTENGYSDYGEIDDQKRVEFYQLYLSELLNAIYEDGVDIKAYTFWSLLDNFEWLEGYVASFGLYSVDFNDANRPRTAKTSVELVKNITSTRRIANGAHVVTSFAVITLVVPLVLTQLF